MGIKHSVLIYGDIRWTEEHHGVITIQHIESVYGVTPEWLGELLQDDRPPILRKPKKGVFELEDGKIYVINYNEKYKKDERDKKKDKEKDAKKTNYIKFEDLEFTDIEQFWRGGSGQVKLAKWRTGGGVIVAVKKFHGGSMAIKDFQIEIGHLKKLHHPNIVQFFGWSEDPEKNLYLVMQYLRGGNLRSFLEKSELVDWPFILRVLCNVAEGMSFLHSEEMKLLHRDLKPENIVIEKKDTLDPRGKIIDFGVSTNTISMNSTGEKTDFLSGTCGYFAPELWKDKIQSKKSDVFAFGITMMDAIKRGYAWGENESARAIQQSIEQGNRPNIPDYVPDEIRQLITACWDELPNNRPSFVQIRTQLENIIKVADSYPSLLLHLSGKEENGEQLISIMRDVQVLGPLKLLVVRKDEEKIKILIFVNQAPITIQETPIKSEFKIELSKGQIIKMLKVGKDSKSIFKHIEVHEDAQMSFVLTFSEFGVNPLKGNLEVAYNFGFLENSFKGDIQQLVRLFSTQEHHVPPLDIRQVDEIQEKYPMSKESNLKVLKNDRENISCVRLFKIAVIGDMGVGKSTIIHRLQTGELPVHNQQLVTIGNNYSNIDVEYRDQTMQLHIYDTAGQERFRSMTRQFYRNADAIILVVDPTGPDMMESLQVWQEEIKDQETQKIVFVNKMDLATPSVAAQIKNLVKFCPVPCRFLSAKTGLGLEAGFEVAIEKILENSYLKKDDSYQHKYAEGLALRLLVTGNKNTGKANLVNRFVNEKFTNVHTDHHADYLRKTVQIQNTVVELVIMYGRYTTNLYRQKNGILLTFSLTDRESFLDVEEILKEIGENASSNVVVGLVGCKSDLKEERQVSYKEARQFAKRIGITYYETSAKEAVGVHNAFISLASNILSKMEQNITEVKGPSTIKLDEEKTAAKASCCSSS